MGYDAKIMRRARARFEEDKQRRAEMYAERRRTVHARIPRIEEIDTTLRATVSRIIASALRRGTDPRPPLAALEQENLSLRREKAELLVSNGFSADFLDEKPNCRVCNDSGYDGQYVCRCLQEYYSREQNAELSHMLDLGTQTFDTFSLDWYDAYDGGGERLSTREKMQKVYRAAREYAETFGPDSGNLLFSGEPGLGKTFLSASIARVVSDEGFSVVYDTASHIFSQFEAYKFNRENEYEDDAQSDIHRIMNCDLLIIDDLGTEMTTSFVQSTLYQIVNTRLSGKKTIISTNLKPQELGQRYSPQILSRIEGEYRILPFFGEDIRRLKKQRRV